MRIPRAVLIVVPIILMVMGISLTVLFLTVGDRDAADTARRGGAQEQVAARLGLEQPLEGGELEFTDGDLTCTVERVLASSADVTEAVRAAPDRVAANGAASQGVVLAADEEEVGACTRALERRLGGSAG